MAQFPPEIAAADLHVRATGDGTWAVHLDGSVVPLSEHDDASSAVRAAAQHAGEHGGAVIVHDRYNRTRLAARAARQRASA